MFKILYTLTESEKQDFVSSKSENKCKEHKLIKMIGTIVSVTLFRMRFRQSK